MFQRKLLFVLIAVFAMVATVSCKKKDAAKSPLVADVASVTFPANVLAFGGVKSMDDFTSTLTNLVGKFDERTASMLGAQVPALMQSMLLGVKNLTWMDAKKPIRFAVLDYKQYQKPLVLVFPHKGQAEVIAALPDSKTEAAPDNAFKYAAVGQNLFVNVVGDHVVFTMEEKAFAAAKPFVEGDLARYAFTEILDIQGSGTNLQKVASAEIAKLREQLNASLQGSQDAALLPGVDKMAQSEIQAMMDALMQIDVARLVLRFDGENATLRGSAKVAEGKSLAAFVAGMKDRKLEAYKGLPADSWFALAMNIDPKVIEDMAAMGMSVWADLMKLEPADKAKLESLMKEGMALSTGDGAFAIGKDGDFPFRVISIGGVKDSARARTLNNESYGMLLSKGGKLLEAYMGDAMKDLPKLDWSSMKSVTDGLRPLTTKLGLDILVRQETVSGITVDALDLTMDYTKIPKDAAGQTAMIEKMVGGKLSFALAYDKNHTYAAFGKDVNADIRKASEAQGTGGPLAPVLAKADTTPVVAAYLSLPELLKIVARFENEVKVALPGLDSVSGDFGLAFLMGSHGDRIIDASLMFPVTKFATLLPKTGQPAESPAPAAAPAPAVAPAPATPM